MSELDDIRARRAAISEGVLSLHASEHYDISLYREGTPYPVACFEYQADADFFTAAPADIDTLLAEVERLTGELSRQQATSIDYESYRLALEIARNETAHVAALTAERDALAQQLQQAQDAAKRQAAYISACVDSDGCYRP